MKRNFLAAILLMGGMLSGSLNAQVPQMINYQGRIAVGASPFTGTGQFKFALVDGTGATSYWSNDGTSTAGSEPTAAVALPVVNGLYVVPMGDVTLPNMTAIPATVFGNTDVRVRVWFNDGVNGSQLLSPDQRISSVGYAMMAETVADGAITTEKIAPGAVKGTVVWENITGISHQAEAGRGYVANNSEEVTITLPSAPNIGDIVRLSGAGRGGWRVAQNAVQQVRGSGFSTLVGSNWVPVSQLANSQAAENIASSSDGNKLVAGTYGNTVQTSTDGGASWLLRLSINGPNVPPSVASSEDGVKLVIAPFGGAIQTSTNSGLNWTVQSQSGNFRGVASSADGAKLVAVTAGGQIYTSADSGVTWVARDSNRNWIGVASSADGTRLVAIVQNGQVYTSSDSGITWTARDSNRNWNRVASSTDGSKLVASVSGGQIYTSADSGNTWTARDSNRSWTALASSANGVRLVALVQSGQAYTSSDSGMTWTARDTGRVWYGLACSDDGTKIVATAVNYNNNQWFLYRSVPTIGVAETTSGLTGSISGGQNTAVELQSVGGGKWLTLSSSGAVFPY
jgi:hypothetical protein